MQRKITIGGEEVTLLNDECFAAIRSKHSVDERLVGGDEFSFSWLDAGGGKGGSLMSRTKNKRLMVKELSGDDHASLERVAPVYSKRMLEDSGTAPSLLSVIFYHFERSDGKCFIVMTNLLPTNCQVEELWDLKGCADDKVMIRGGQSVAQVHKRWFRCHWLVAEATCLASSLPQPRQDYYQGKRDARKKTFELGPRDCQDAVSAMRRDVSMLRTEGLMDYSLLVGIVTKKKGEAAPEGGVAGQPYVVKTATHCQYVYVGIIDFLQGWTTGKKVAHVIKAAFAPKPISTVEPVAYARQFLEDAERRFIARLETQRKESDASREVGGTSVSPVTPAGVAVQVVAEGDVGNEACNQGLEDDEAGAMNEDGESKRGNDAEAAMAEGVEISLVPGSQAGAHEGGETERGEGDRDDDEREANRGDKGQAEVGAEEREGYESADVSEGSQYSPVKEAIAGNGKAATQQGSGGAAAEGGEDGQHYDV